MKSEEFILETVEKFYAKATADFLIGYHFRHIDNFETHIPRIAAFWEIQLLGHTQRVLDAPFDIINKHVPLLIKPGEVGRWSILFKETLSDQKYHHPEELELIDKWYEKLDWFREKFLSLEKLYPKSY